MIPVLLALLLAAGCAAPQEAVDAPGPAPSATQASGPAPAETDEPAAAPIETDEPAAAPAETGEPADVPSQSSGTAAASEPLEMEQYGNPIWAFIEAYGEAVEPYTALLDAPVELMPDSFRGLMAVAQHPVRLQKMLYAVSSLEYDGEGRWSVGVTLPAGRAAEAGVEEIRSGYAFTGYTEDGVTVSGTLKDDLLQCTWRNEEGLLAGAEAERVGDGWRCVVYLDELADGVWLAGDTLLYTTGLYFEDCLYEDEPLMMEDPSRWDAPYLKVHGQTAVTIDPDQMQGEQEQ